MGGSENLFLPNVEWIGSTDVRVILALLDGIGSSEDYKAVLEVGVWKGSFCQAVLVNRPSSKILGIDPYPGNEAIRDLMYGKLRQLGVENRFSLVDDWARVQPNKTFDLIHIDGLHTESAVRRDLSEAQSLLRKDGVLVVDDIRHFWFPGIASAVYGFVANSDFRVLAMTATKAYLSRTHSVQHHQTRLRSAISKFDDLSVSDFYGQLDGLPLAYVQSPEIHGVKPILVHMTERRKKNPIIALVILLTPPLLVKLYARVFKQIRHALGSR